MSISVSSGKNKNHYWNLEWNVSNGFNRLKAKFFNLIEVMMIDDKQREAVKGLIKGFANDEYKYVIENMRYTANVAGFLKEEEIDEIPPTSAEPLENN